MESSRAQDINSQAEYAQALLVATGARRLLVIDFSAKWCGPCQTIAPVFSQLSNKYPTVDFIKVDVDDQPDIAAAHGVSALPTFILMKNGQRVDEMRGANASRLEQLIKKHMADEKPEESDLKLPLGHTDITEYVDQAQGECLNENTEHRWVNIFKKDESFLESDTDEQLLLYIPFNQPVKIHSLCFQSPDTDSAPQIVKLFANTRDADFQSVESIPATQTLELHADDVKGDKLVPLRFVKFQNVSSITIFIESNQAGEAKTAIQRLRFIGQSQTATDMKEFKRVAGEKGEVHG